MIKFQFFQVFQDAYESCIYFEKTLVEIKDLLDFCEQ